MKERPILCSTEMVKAIVAGVKTVTRRTRGLDLINFCSNEVDLTGVFVHQETDTFFANFDLLGVNEKDYDHIMNKSNWRLVAGNVKCPYGKPGDILYVRETFFRLDTVLWPSAEMGFFHKASYVGSSKLKWRPAIHMPKHAARIWLQIESIRVERLADISEEQAIAEGVIEYEDGTFHNYFTQKGLRTEDGVECLLAKGSFQSLWCSINGVESWESNPWVWVIQFKVLSTTGRPEALREMEVANG